MKNKSSNHKAFNRFKFASFADRVSSIDVRHTALYHIEHVNADGPEDDDTYFYNTVQKWRVLNLTTEYVNFSKKVGDIHTLPQLLHRKDDVVNLLVQNINEKNVLTLQPLLELVVVLAKDLQEDFYPYFPRILTTLISLLNTKDTEQLEWTLVCLAYLFKSLRTYLKRDILIVFQAVLPLLSDSMPWFVKNFAAESFAFVARDIKDKKKFLHLIVKTVGNKGDGIIGCGRLLFEVMRGVNKQFHSCAKSFLEILLESLNDKGMNQNVYFDILTQVVSDTLEVINAKNAHVFWSTIINFAGIIQASSKASNEFSALDSAVKLIGQALEYENGSFLINISPLLSLIHQLLASSPPEHILNVTSKLSVLLLISKTTNISHEDSVLLVKGILNIPHYWITIHFVQEVVSSTCFDIIILPLFISRLEDINTDVIQVLCKICIEKSPLTKNGNNLYSWVRYPIDCGFKTDEICDVLVKHISRDVEDILDNPDDCVSSLICIPHVKHLDMKRVQGSLEKVLIGLIEFLKCNNKVTDSNGTIVSSQQEESIFNVLFILCVALETAIHTVNINILENICASHDLIKTLISHICNPESICSLRCLDLYLTACYREESLDLSLLETLHLTLEENLKSPFHEVRLLTTHIYSLFENKIQKLNSNNNDRFRENFDKEKIEVFSLCFSIESISPSVENYREQLLSLSKMAYGTTQHQLATDAGYEILALKYALGFLNINFKLLWDPLKSFIRSYANNMQSAKFWETFYSSLKQATTNSRKKTILPNYESVFTGKSEIINKEFIEYCQLIDKPDYSLYRIHLWEVLQETPTLSEAKNRDITPLLLDFMHVEFEKSDLGNVFVNDDNDTRSVENSSLMETTFKIEPIEDENHDNLKDQENNILTKTTYDTFIAVMKVYTNIQNPKAMYKEATLKNLYLEYLMHKNPVIQKIALDCLMRYKNKHLTPYKGNLYNLVDGKRFKDELRTFRIQADEEGIKLEDRDEVIPIILRLTFSKMITNMGVDKKGGGQLRKSLVIRFLFGCEEIELITFTNMAFSMFKTYLNLEISELPQIISQTLEELVNIPPKKILGALQLVDTMREQFTRPGQEKLMKHLYKIVLCIGSLINAILTQPKKLQMGYSKILKEIRNRCTLSMSRFFDQFEGYAWDFEKDVSSAFDVFVWPIVEKLPIEGIHSPTALLKLFLVWSEHPQYHPLLNVYKGHESFTSLYFLMQLLHNNKIHYSVNEVCMQILEKLLTLECGEDKPMIDIPHKHCVPLPSAEIQSLGLKEKLNYGSSTLVLHTRIIVDILKQKFSKINAKKLQKRDLLIMARITELVFETDVVDKMLCFSLPILINRIGQNTAEDTLQSSISALSILLCKSSKPSTFVRLITPLFSQVVPAAPRITLCKALVSLGGSSDEIDGTVSVIRDMNATDEKWIDQPDFEKRVSAYKRIYELIQEQEANADLGALVIHNCFFTVRNSTDLSLRNMAMSCLQTITPKLVMQFKDSSDKEYLINDTLLILLKKTLKQDNEEVHMEGIALLGELVRECPLVPGVFSELYPLINTIDSEVDFFENLKHLQFHRRIRAFHKLCTYMKGSKDVPSIKTLTQIIIPLASHYICSEKYLPKHALVDAAVDTIGTVCRLLPWRQYEVILKYYVNKLQKANSYQKQLIKIVGVVLDAFHFDLSKVDSTDIATETVDESKDPVEEKDEELDVPDETPQDIADVHSQILFDKVQVLSPSNAKRAIQVIRDILNKLKWSSSQTMKFELQHKKAKTGLGSREEEEIMKLPMALAIVKLLQKLPEQMLESNIHGIFIKVANYLKSPLISVRTEARDIISKVTLAVGTTHLGTLLELLSTMLSRGIHVHVLISTVHTVLLAVKDSFVVGEIDKHIQHILKVCLNDLFGKASEEKEVAKLGHKAPEAKPSLKSFSTLRIVAQNIVEPSLVELLKPFKEIVESSYSKKNILKVQNALHNICLGLGANQNISSLSLLAFVNDVLSGSIEKLMIVRQKHKTPKDDREERYKALRPDCLLIAPDPKGRKGFSNKVVRNSVKANSHILIEFGLTLLHTVLQKDGISGDSHKDVINNCGPCLVDSLKSSQVKVATIALKCVTTIWSKRLVLPFIQNEIENMTAMIFQILHRYSTTGLSKKDDNFHLVSNAFKAITASIREVKYHTINAEQMKALLLYAEHDINHHEKQATAFSLLKTIIGAKYRIPEIHDIMKKVESISIQSENPRTREEARIVMLAFIMNYPLGNKLVQHIQFYLNQLNYELDHGRISAVKMLETCIEKFTEDVLNEHAALMYLSIGTRLVNDPSTDCKILIARCLEQLVQRLSAAKRNELFKINMTLFKSCKPPHVEMAAQLCSRFVSVEKQNFKNRLETLLPELTNHLYEEDSNVGRCVKINGQGKDETNDTAKDNSYIQILMLLEKISETYPVLFNDMKYVTYVDEMANNCQALLAHPCAWVRIMAAKYLSSYLNSLNMNEFAKILSGRKKSERLCFCSHGALKSLVLDHSSQLIPGEVSSDMADVVCTNLMSLLKITAHISNCKGEHGDDNISVFWILRVIKSCINSEVTKSPGSNIIRMSVFKSIEETKTLTSADTALVIARLLLSCIVREMNQTNPATYGIKEQAVKLGQLLSQTLGDITYNDLLSKVQAKLNAKRKERKQKVAQDKLNNPQKAAKRRETIKEKRKEYKRKKLDQFKGRTKKSRPN